MTPSRRAAASTPIGWREWIELPDLCPVPIKVKVDTGARTSALHAFDLEIDGEGTDAPTARFVVRALRDVDHPSEPVTVPVVEFREIRSSDGRVETRPVVRTTVRLGDDTWDIDVSLTDRDQMGFRMLLGRTAVRRRYVVDPGRSYLRSAPDSPDLTDAPDEEPS